MCKKILLFCCLFLLSPVLWAKSAKGTPSSTQTIPLNYQEIIAQTLLRSAEDFLKVDKMEFAKRYLKDIVKKYPGTQAAVTASKHLQNSSLFLDTSGRVEFTVFSSIYGLYLGTLVPLALDAKEVWVYGASIILGGAIGFSASFFGTSGREMTAGQASIVSSATSWGVWNGVAIGLLADMDLRPFLFTTLGVSALGYGASLIAGRYVKITAGQSAFGSSLGVWSGALFTLALAAGKVYTNKNAMIGSILAISNIGFIGGMFLQPVIKFSRSRTSFISLGGLLGGALGGAITLIAASSIASEAALFLPALAGALGGLALTTWLTRKMKQDTEWDPTFQSMGSLLQYHKGSWFVGVPVPNILPLRLLTGQDGYEITAPILAGKW